MAEGPSLRPSVASVVNYSFRYAINLAINIREVTEITEPARAGVIFSVGSGLTVVDLMSESALGTPTPPQRPSM